MLSQQDRLEESRQMSEYAIERLTECPTTAGGVASSTEIMGQLYHTLGSTLRSMGEVEAAVDAMLSAQEHFDLAAAERARQQAD